MAIVILCLIFFYQFIIFFCAGQEGTFVKASENLYMLIQGLLQKDPNYRIDWLELCLHPFWDGELSHLADSFDVPSSRSIMYSTDTSSVSNRDDSRSTVRQKDSPVDILVLQEANPDKKLSRPETVPQNNTACKLQTRSLQIPNKDSESLTSSIKSVALDDKQAWKGTYHLERGLAVIDLTELETNRSESRASDSATDKRNLSYSESRKSKSNSPSRRTSVDYSLDASMNSATSLGYSEIIPHLGGPDLNVLDHLYHPSDLLVCPIAENKALVKLPTLKWDNNILNFSIIPNDRLQNSSKEEIQNYLRTILQTCYQTQRKAGSAADKSSARQKMHVAAYLATASRVEEVSNHILNDEFITYFLCDLKTSPSQDLKMRVGELISMDFLNDCF